MANQITDNRTAVEAFDVTTNAVDLTGAGAGTQDVDVFIEGTASVGAVISNSRTGIMYNAGAAQNWANNVFYIWINCGIVGLLDTKANAGFTIRFCGATVTDWFEVYVGGSDSWPSAVQGGWVQFVVDIEDARAAAIVGTVGGVNGTTPATSAIQYVGWSGITAGTMTKMVDNTWIDEIRRLPDGNPGIIIEGRNGGVTDWNSADIATQLGVSVGTFLITAGGAYKVNTPIQFGINDTTVHGFTDTNSIWLWDDQEFAPIDLYGLSALGNAGGTTNVTLGVKTGTGDAASGAQGLIVSAAASGVRWDMDFNDANVDNANFYGCQFIHGGDFLLDDIAVSCIGVTYLDCSSALVTASEQLRCKVVDPDVIAGVAFMTSDGMDNIVFCEFESNGVGHAIELVTPIDIAQISKGNLFTAYDIANPGVANDKSVYNNQAGSIVISNTSGGNLTEDFHVRNGISASTDVQANISITLTGMKDNTEVRVYDQSDPPIELDGVENATAGTVDDRSFTFALSATTVVDIVVFNLAWILPPNNRIDDFTIPSVDSSLPISQVVDRNFENP